MEELQNYRQQLLQRFETIVDELRVAWGNVPPEKWHTPSGPDGRTPHQTLAHLRDIEAQALAARLRRILDEDTPQLSLFDDEGWMDAHYRPGEPPEAILDEYARLRGEELAWLRAMPPESWNRCARHPWYGLRTLQWWVERCVEYAEQHVDQLNVAQAG